MMRDRLALVTPPAPLTCEVIDPCAFPFLDQFGDEPGQVVLG
jgi:hypothetical protein